MRSALAHPRPSNRFRLQVDQLEDRLAPAVTAFFFNGILLIAGDGAADNILVADANKDGVIEVTDNDIGVAISGGTPTKANTASVVINAGDGNDTITLDKTLNTLDANGKLAFAPTAALTGDGGNDTITVNTGGFIGGLLGNPIVGNTSMHGGAGDDTLNSGFGNDVMEGNDGNDTLRWLPGTLNDDFEGGNGIDNAVIIGNGGTSGDALQLSAKGTRLLFQRTNLVPFAVGIGTCETVTLNPDGDTGAGADTVTIKNLTGVANLQQVVVNLGGGNDTLNAGAQANAAVRVIGVGGDGDDFLRGGAGNDILLGGSGSDVIRGGSGNDVLLGQAGNDNLGGGDGSDVLLGGDGNDALNGGGADGAPDILVGGDGADTFIQFSGENDLFTDFNPSEGDVLLPL
jgi:Ca2+-binding RTX toxin-like protein